MLNTLHVICCCPECGKIYLEAYVTTEFNKEEYAFKHVRIAKDCETCKCSLVVK